MVVLELRTAWVLLGPLLWFVLAHDPRPAWFLVAGVPWLAGLILLAVPRTARAIAQVYELLIADRGVRIAATILVALGIAVAHLFTVAGALSLVAWAGALALSLAAVGRAGMLRTAILGAMTSSVTLAATVLLLELALRTESLAGKFGFPGETAAWEERYDRLWEHNVLGFRSRHEAVRRRPGVHRILALGDSFTWGDKVADSDSTWPALLESELAGSLGAAGVEVISMAQRGYTTANEAELLQRLGWQLDPDLVIIQFFANDALPSFPNLGRVGGEWLCPQRHLVPVRLRTELIQSSAVVALLEKQFNALLSPRPCYMEFGRLYRESSTTRAEFETALRLIADSAGARQTPVVLVLFPFLAPGEWTAGSHPLAAVHELVAAIAREKGLSVLDLAERFAADGGDWRRWWATPYDSHPGGAAQHVAALAIAQFLRERGIVAAAPAPGYGAR